MTHRGAGVLAVSAALLVGAPFPALADAVPPPIVVEQVEPTRPGLVVTPAVAGVEPGPDGRTEVVHQVVNGTDQELALALSIQGLEPETGRPSASAPLPVEVAIAGDRVTLAAGEAAEVTSVAADPPGPFAYALVAEVVGADPPVAVTSIVVVDPADADVAVDVPELTPEAVVVRFAAADGPLLVDAAVRVRTWFGRTLAEVSESDLLVWQEDPVVLRFRLEGVRLPGPYHVDVVARAGDGDPADLTVTRWLWPTASVIAIGGALVILTGTLLALVWLRMRRGPRRPSEDEPETVDPAPPA